MRKREKEKKGAENGKDVLMEVSADRFEGCAFLTMMKFVWQETDGSQQRFSQKSHNDNNSNRRQTRLTALSWWSTSVYSIGSVLMLARAKHSFIAFQIIPKMSWISRYFKYKRFVSKVSGHYPEMSSTQLVFKKSQPIWKTISKGHQTLLSFLLFMKLHYTKLHGLEEALNPTGLARK